MVPIKDLQTYIDGMEKSIVDKLWWLDYMPQEITTVYDFGCADGALLSAVHLLRPDFTLRGYDCNEDMVIAAQTRLPQALVSRFPLVNASKNTIVIASSVLHEVYSYKKHVEKDLKAIFDCGAKYVAIRDMFYTDPIISYAEVMENVMKVLIREPKEKIAQFEDIWGPLYENKNLTHYLKYRYEKNWEREVHENYFAFDCAALNYIIMQFGYRIVHKECYTLPFITQKVKEDFGISLNTLTHIKILLERSEL